MSIIKLLPSGGSRGLTSGNIVMVNAQEITIEPVQIVGFIPLIPCDESECRHFIGGCYINPVFGSISAGKPSYENDFSTFLLSDIMFRQVKYYLQKLDVIFKTWSDIAAISDGSLYGTYYPQGTYVEHVDYHGYRLNWGAVLTNNGSGYYRIRIANYNSDPQKPEKFPYCLISEPFHLLPFNCNVADRTTKFETLITGKIGSIDTDGLLFNLCGINWFDSIRMAGFFGKEITGYDSVELEYQTGLIDPVRDEALQKFKWSSKMLPKYIHDRFKSYGLMADKIYVSDYNKNNSDYFIKEKQVRKNGGYEPEYNKGSRLSSVIVDFKGGLEGVIKSLSCELK